MSEVPAQQSTATLTDAVEDQSVVDDEGTLFIIFICSLVWF